MSNSRAICLLIWSGSLFYWHDIYLGVFGYYLDKIWKYRDLRTNTDGMSDETRIQDSLLVGRLVKANIST